MRQFWMIGERDQVPHIGPDGLLQRATPAQTDGPANFLPPDLRNRVPYCICFALPEVTLFSKRP